MAECKKCGKEYKQLGGTQVFCSDDCAFEYYVIKNDIGCWGWRGPVNGDNRATFRFRIYNDYCKKNVLKRKTKKYTLSASVYAYIKYIGSFMPGLCVCHTCDNTLCCNQNHLFLGTKKDNSADMVNKDRQVRGERRHNAKIKEEDIKKIFDMRASGETQPSIARFFGVSNKTIWDILNKRNWKYLHKEANITEKPKKVRRKKAEQFSLFPEYMCGEKLSRYDSMPKQRAENGGI